jgi:hypothetical protein
MMQIRQWKCIDSDNQVASYMCEGIWVARICAFVPSPKFWALIRDLGYNLGRHDLGAIWATVNAPIYQSIFGVLSHPKSLRGLWPIDLVPKN